MPRELLKFYILKNGFKFNDKEFKTLFKKFREISKQGSKLGNAFENKKPDYLIIDSNINPTKFEGYDNLTLKSKVLVSKENFLILDRTVFYATSGGQEYDIGYINNSKVLDVYKKDDVFIHVIEENDFTPGETVELKVDKPYRGKSTMNHSAVHLVFVALEQTLKQQVFQLGSKLNDNFFRFDFNFNRVLTDMEIKKIENITNEWINEKIKTNIYTVNFFDVKKLKINYLESANYKAKVRVVEFPNISKDLCGGTHVKNTSDIEKVKITRVEKRGSNVLRIWGISGINSINDFYNNLKHKNKNELIESIKNFSTVNNSPEFIKIKDEFVNDVESGKKLLFDDFKFEINKMNDLKRNEIFDSIKRTIEENKDKKLALIDLNNIEKKSFQNFGKRILNLNIEINSIILLSNLINGKKTLNIIFPSETNRLIDKLNENIKSLNIFGGGNKNVYQYGGDVVNINKLIELIKNENN